MPVNAWLSPESINTVVMDGRRPYLPLPIAPLNWAKAALAMALRDYEKAVSETPQVAGRLIVPIPA